MRKLGVRYCASCHREFEPWRIDQRLCGRECHDRYFVEEKRLALAAYRAQQRYPQMFVVEDEDDAAKVA